jgi:hypothetical protein
MTAGHEPAADTAGAAPTWANPAARWLLLAPSGTTAVAAADRYRAARELRALPVGASVAIAGRRRLRMLARQGDVAPATRYLSLPGTEVPVAVSASGPGLRWVANSVLTVPPGRARGHLAATCAVRLARRMPWLLNVVGEQVLLGSRR